MTKISRHKAEIWIKKIFSIEIKPTSIISNNISSTPAYKKVSKDITKDIVKAKKINVIPVKSHNSELQLEEQFKYRWVERFIISLLLLGQVVIRLLKGKIYIRNLMEHLATVGIDSLFSTILIAYFAGMIFTIQTARELLHYGAISALGGAFALAFCRELAPVLTAGIVAGQVGSAFAAEIGEMQVTEQIDALYMLRTNPIDYLVVPRVIACSIMLPILTIFALVVGIAGGVFIAVNFYHLPASIFLDSVRNLLELKDLIAVIIKSFIFGIAIAIIGCGWGLTTTGGAKGVSRSTTAAVVTSWVVIFVVDFMLSLAIFEELNIY